MRMAEVCYCSYQATFRPAVFSYESRVEVTPSDYETVSLDQDRVS